MRAARRQVGETGIGDLLHRASSSLSDHLRRRCHQRPNFRQRRRVHFGSSRMHQLEKKPFGVQLVVAALVRRKRDMHLIVALNVLAIAR